MTEWLKRYLIIPSVGKGVEQLELWHTVADVEMLVPRWSSHPTPRYLPNGNENTCSHKDHIQMFHSSFRHDCSKPEAAQRSIHPVDNHWAVRRDNSGQVQPHGWNSEAFYGVKEATPKRQHARGVSFIRHSRKAKSQKQGADQRLPEDGVSFTSKGHQRSFQGNGTGLILTVVIDTWLHTLPKHGMFTYKGEIYYRKIRL